MLAERFLIMENLMKVLEGIARLLYRDSTATVLVLQYVSRQV